MRRLRVLSTLGFCFFALTAVAMAPNRKAGLWDVTTTMTWQKSPFQAPPATPRNEQVCVTQAMIDKYGGNVPTMRNGCQLENVSVKADGMSADMVCSGAMNGKASFASTWSDGEHATSTVHFTGTIAMGPAGNGPIEWTSTSTSTFKSADCGAVKPVTIPGS